MFVERHIFTPEIFDEGRVNLPQIKLVIWDLDDTLWTGTLADGDEVSANAFRLETVRMLNGRGVVSSICSKNDAIIARQKLEELGVWSEFVFVTIGFNPKGEAIKNTIEQMQLRAENVLFVDDNMHNLAEAKFHSPNINILDASSPDCDAILIKLMEGNAHVNRSRVLQYKEMEQRYTDRKLSTASTEEFLESCDIHVTLAHMTDTLEFAKRIEELVNRANQLNFTKSRLKEGSTVDLISTYYGKCWPFAIFAWDKYGYHGLIGFVVIENRMYIRHFVFSCRAMHLGIEGWLLEKIQADFQLTLDLSDFPIKPSPAPWLRVEPFAGETRDLIRKRELGDRQDAPQLKVMLDCQSASVAHYAELSDFSDCDLTPRVFAIRSIAAKQCFDSHWPSALVYGAATDYPNDRSPSGLWTVPEYDELSKTFCNFLTASKRHALVLLPPEDTNNVQAHIGITRERVRMFNSLWRNLMSFTPELQCLSVDTFSMRDEIVDVRHYAVPLLREIGARVRAWYFELPIHLSANAAMTRLIGHVDVAGAEMCLGWAQHAEAPEVAVSLQFFADGNYIGTALANRYRDDLKLAGLGSGRHAFEFRLPVGCKNSTITVRRSSDGVELRNS